MDVFSGNTLDTSPRGSAQATSTTTSEFTAQRQHIKNQGIAALSKLPYKRPHTESRCSDAILSVHALRGLGEARLFLSSPVRPQPVPAGSNGSNGPTAGHSPAPQPRGEERPGPASPEGRAAGGGPLPQRFHGDSPPEGAGGELLRELWPARSPRWSRREQRSRHLPTPLRAEEVRSEGTQDTRTKDLLCIRRIQRNLSLQMYHPVPPKLHVTSGQPGVPRLGTVLNLACLEQVLFHQLTITTVYFGRSGCAGQQEGYFRIKVLLEEPGLSYNAFEISRQAEIC
ncbi:uncharacterized protein LOC136007868 [Lathamus discolor]|uniref:uncharacterized protein LOC136007868 n=1 Tax=Lathamus discolor TaxID=678569 RepID=UPI0032B8018B